MSADQLDTEFSCSDCNKSFDSASNLLTHFALHASQVNNHQNANTSSKQNSLLSCKSDKKCVPGLYPINMIKIKSEKTENNKFSLFDVFNLDQKDNSCEATNKISSDGNNSNVQIDFDTDFNPLKYCSISMDIKDQSSSVLLLNNTNVKNNSLTEGTTRKKYPCSFCSKVFGWSTDLKRHVLVHTGERPFKCKLCDASFTRNFLLQKHENKIHLNKVESKFVIKNKTMPSLKPVHSNVLHGIKSSRKQDKQKIKRKCFYDSSINRNEEFCGLLRSQLNFIDKETIVQ